MSSQEQAARNPGMSAEEFWRQWKVPEELDRMENGTRKTILVMHKFAEAFHQYVSQSQPVPAEGRPDHRKLRADTLLGIYCAGRPLDVAAKELGPGINWPAWQRVSDWANEVLGEAAQAVLLSKQEEAPFCICDPPDYAGQGKIGPEDCDVHRAGAARLEEAARKIAESEAGIWPMTTEFRALRYKDFLQILREILDVNSKQTDKEKQ